MLKKQRFLILVLLTVALIMSTLSGCSSKTVQKEASSGVGVENGIIDLEGTTISFGKNNVADGEDAASMRTIEATKYEVANGLSSKLYELTLNQEYTEPLTLRFPVPEDYTGAAEEALLVGLGLECEYDSGRVGAPTSTAAILCGGRQARQILREQNLCSPLTEQPLAPPCGITTIKSGVW